MTPVLARRLGNDRAFERLYRKHAGDVYRYALVVLRNEADAEDVTQTTFLNAYRAFEKGERPQKPQNWLIAIAHNVCRQRFRQAQRRPAEVGYEEELAESVVEEDALSAEDIRRALGHLAFNQRAALVMRELEGRSYQEIAEILGVSVSAVETLIFRARRALREQLEQSISCQDAELAISRRLRPQPAGPPGRAQGPRGNPAPRLARRPVRWRRWGGCGRRPRAQGRSADGRRPRRDRRRLRRREAGTPAEAAPGGRGRADRAAACEQYADQGAGRSDRVHAVSRGEDRPEALPALGREGPQGASVAPDDAGGQEGEAGNAGPRAVARDEARQADTRAEDEPRPRARQADDEAGRAAE